MAENSREKGAAIRGLFNQSSVAAQLIGNMLTAYLFSRVMARQFGTSGIKDAFDIANSVPMVVLSIGGFGWLHMVVTSHFSRLRATNEDAISGEFSGLLTLFAAVSIIVCIPIMFFVSSLAKALAPGFPPELLKILSQQILLMLPLVVTIGIGTYLSAIMAAYGMPVSMELGLMLSRIPVLAVAYLSKSQMELPFIAALMVIGGVGGCLIQWAFTKQLLGIVYRPRWPSWDESSRRLIQQSLAFIAAGLLSSISFAHMRRLATISGTGTVAAITYALSLVGPLSLVIGKPFAVVFGPAYIRGLHKRESSVDKFMWIQAASAIALGTLVAFILSVEGPRLLGILYGGGRFDAVSVAGTSALLKVFVWALPPLVLNWVVLFPMINRSNPATGGIVYCAGYGTQIVLNKILFTYIGVVGLAWSYVVCAIIQAAIGLMCVLWLKETRSVTYVILDRVPEN